MGDYVPDEERDKVLQTLLACPDNKVSFTIALTIVIDLFRLR